MENGRPGLSAFNTCRLCGGRIHWDGHFWLHTTNHARHPATPRKQRDLVKEPTPEQPKEVKK